MMGFYQERQTFDEQASASSNLPSNEDIGNNKKSSSSFLDYEQQTNNNKLESSITSTTSTSVFASIKSLFTSAPDNQIRSRANSTARSRSGTLTSTHSHNSYRKHAQSSGYHSLETSSKDLEDSWDIDDTYIKVCKFTDSDDANEVGVFGTYKEYKEQMQQQQLASDIRKIIENYQEPTRLLKISDFLALRTAGDVLNLSHCEPYGLKGCKLILLVNDGAEEFNLGTLYPEKGIFSTFEITLVLHLKRSPCRKLPFFRCRQQTMHILEQYELRKEKMYTSKSRRSSPTYCR
eukprot:TCONS_00054991-protein